MYVCISYNTGKSALPDIYARLLRVRTTQGQVHIYQASMSACVITNMLHFWHYKNLLKPEIHCSASLYSNRH